MPSIGQPPTVSPAPTKMTRKHSLSCPPHPCSYPALLGCSAASGRPRRTTRRAMAAVRSLACVDRQGWTAGRTRAHHEWKEGRGCSSARGHPPLTSFHERQRRWSGLPRSGGFAVRRSLEPGHPARQRISKSQSLREATGGADLHLSSALTSPSPASRRTGKTRRQRLASPRPARGSRRFPNPTTLR